MPLTGIYTQDSQLVFKEKGIEKYAIYHLSVKVIGRNSVRPFVGVAERACQKICRTGYKYIGRLF